MQTTQLKRGITLIELLVVVAVVALLSALVFCALQSAREASRRVQCTNNLRQLGTGLQAYVSLFSVFPAARGGIGQSLHVSMLPAIEQGAVYNSFNWEVKLIGQPANATVRSIQIATFLCPSDGLSLGIPSTNYAGNVGDVYSDYAPPSNGLFSLENSFVSYHITSAAVRDGQSSTAAMSEWLLGVDDASERSRVLFRAANAGAGMSRASFAAKCLALEEMVIDTNSYVQKGRYWVIGQWLHSVYDHVLPVNSPSCLAKLSTSRNLAGAGSSNSLHPGGANTMFADGHVQFIRNSVSESVWRALGTRDGGEAVAPGVY